ncbi:MAG: histidine ammonia-lyase [Bacillota bacterium]
MIILNGENLTLELLYDIARNKTKVGISDTCKTQVQTSRDRVETLLAEKGTVYGINTGFGKMADTKIDMDDMNQLQENLIKSHACGIGKPMSEAIVRGMMVLRINALIKGFSGIRLETIEALLSLLNNDVIPVVYEKGSLGASGDLVPLAHMALPIIGLGEVIYNGETMTAKEGLNKAGITPLPGLEAKEGLALINGTQAMTSIGALALYDAFNTFHAATKSASLTFEALNGIIDIFDDRVHVIRNQQGQIDVAKMMGKRFIMSKNVTHQGEMRVQDAYSLRCIPQVHGATLDTLRFVKNTIEKEMNAVTDNPIIFEDGKAISAGNFHGQPIALAMDYLGIAMSEIANITERRIERLVNPQLNNGLPAFLVNKCGLNSGFMIVQYAAASLVSENKVLAHPASVDSIPSSANQEDHVSMGTISARKAAKIIEHTRQVVGLELFTAAQALDFRGKDLLSPLNKEVYDTVRRVVPFIREDVMMHQYMSQCEQLIINEKI